MANDNVITKLGIINNALLLCRLPTVSSSGDRKYADTAELIYDEVVLEALTIAPWRWATKTTTLTKKMVPSADDPTVMVEKLSNYQGINTGFAYSVGNYLEYNKPNDMLRPMGIWYKDGYGQVQYNIDDDAIHAPASTDLIIRYVFTGARDVSKFPPTFAKLVEAALAMRLAPLHDESNGQFVMDTYDRAKRNAAIVDESSVGGRRPLFNADQYIRPRLFAGYGGGFTDFYRL